MDRGEFEAGPVETQPKVMYKRKNNPAAMIAIIVLLLAVVGLGVWIAILLTNNNKTEDKKTAGSESGATVTVDENGNVVDNDAKIREMVDEMYAAHSAVFDGYTADKTFDNGVEFSIGDGVIMRTNHSYGIRTDGRSEAYYNLVNSRRSSMDTKATNILSKYGLKKTSEPKGHMSWGNEHYAFYEGNNIICYYGSDYGLAFECSDKSWYSEDDKALIIKLADAYKKKEGEAYPVGYIGAETKDITKNSAGTYERITVSFDDSVGLFYRKTGGEWKYFTGTQAGISCSAYNTSELKEAYAGEKCYEGTNDNLTVK